jgi:hypothetical protein
VVTGEPSGHLQEIAAGQQQQKEDNRLDGLRADFWTYPPSRGTERSRRAASKELETSEREEVDLDALRPDFCSFGQEAVVIYRSN